MASCLRYDRPVPARPLLFGLGLLLCLGGAITCATAEPSDPQAFPSLSDALMLGGIVLTTLGLAGRAPRGRQLLGGRSRAASPSAPAADGEPPA